MTISKDPRVELDGFGTALRTARVAKKITANSFARKRLGFTHQRYSQIESGTALPSKKLLLLLCNELGLDYEAASALAAERCRARRLNYYLGKGDKR